MGGPSPLTIFVWNDAEPRTAAEQMALDQLLAERAEIDGTTVLRLYQWQQDTVSFGANEAALATWDRARLERAEIPCVRRPTGGRAVWHAADDLTYALSAPIASYGGVRAAYQEVHEHLAQALRRLGLDARLAPVPAGRPGLSPGACFDLAVGGEVLVANRKVIGSAQRSFGSALLQHGAIARADRAPALARFRLGGCRDAAATPPTDFPTAAAIADAITSEWYEYGGLPAPVELTSWAGITTVKHAAAFTDPDRTWRR